jgi:hypothetical protein
MSFHRNLSLRSLLAPLAAVVASATVLACSAAPDGAAATSPEQTTLDRAPVTLGRGPGEPVCTPIEAKDPKGTACLADVEAMCQGELKACQADCSCATFFTSCLDARDSAGAVACFSGAKSKAETAVSECAHFAASCHEGTDKERPSYMKLK